MIEILRDPIWQGIGVLLSLLVGLVGFYLMRPHKVWLYAGVSIALIVSGVGLGMTIGQKGSLELEPLFATASGYQIPEPPKLAKLFEYSHEKDLPHSSRFRLTYSFPNPTTESVTTGITIPLATEQDLTPFSAIEVTVLATKGSQVDFVVHSDLGHRQFSKLVVGTGEAQTISIPISEVSKRINAKSVSGFYATASTTTELARGNHTFSISKIRAVRT